MKNSGAAKNAAYSLLRMHDLHEPTLDDLVGIVNTLGFEIIDYSRDEEDEDIRALIRELGISELTKTSRAFTYRKQDVKLLFLEDSMSADEKRYAIAHELGHIILGHMNSGTGFSADMEDEFEANEFAHYLLHPGFSESAGSHPEHGAPGRKKKRTRLWRGILAALILAAAVLGVFGFRMWKSKKAAAVDAYQMMVLDPLSCVDGGRVFGKGIEEFLDGKEEGKDYTVTDVYLDGRVHAYRFHPEFTYFGIPEGNTGIRMFTETGEGITMVCYDFILTSVKTDLITQKLQAMMACIRQTYKRGYDYGLYYDPQDNEKYISFDDFLNGIRQKVNGSYSITWVLNTYGVSLDLNYDENQEISLGSIRFYLPRKRQDDSSSK